MKKIVFVIVSCLLVCVAFSQDSAVAVQTYAPAPAKKITINNRPNDHFLLQVSSDHWTGMTDSMKSHQKGLSRGFGAYFMLDKPFRSSPKFSIGFGVGISSSNIFFKKETIDIKSTTSVLPFSDADLTNHFKKYKISIGYLEVPLEFRYAAKPLTPNKSFKAAIGIKAGTLVNVHTKGKILQDQNGNTLDNYILKENSKKFINSSRFTATARVGYGIISLFGTYQLNNVLKDGAGPVMNLYQVGLTFSGL